MAYETRNGVTLNIPQEIFRAYDIRGVVGSELTVDGAARIGGIFGTYIGPGHKVTIARDVRVHSKVLSDAVRAGLAATGNEVFDLGIVPIPIANFTTYNGSYDYGIYITASHNPAPDNGIRFRRSDGTGFTKENEDIKNLFFTADPAYTTYPKVGGIWEIPSDRVMEEYFRYLSPRIKISAPVKILMDIGCGAAAAAAPRFLTDLGCSVITINGQPDGRFPGRPSEPKGDNMPDAVNALKKGGFDMGVGYDGDGDRCLFFDEKGNSIQVEKVAVLLGRKLAEKKPKGRLIANISCSMLLEKEFQKMGWEVIRTRVGDVFVCEAIKQYGADMGIETSSHFFYPEGYVFDDPILVTARLAEVLAESEESLSSLVAGMPDLPFIEKKYPIPDKIKFEVIEKIKEEALKRGEKVVDIDGVKVIRENGWVLLRCSNTQPVIRLFAEAESKTVLDHAVKEFEERLEEVVSQFPSAV